MYVYVTWTLANHVREWTMLLRMLFPQRSHSAGRRYEPLIDAKWNVLSYYTVCRCPLGYPRVLITYCCKYVL